jgi:DNA-binding HxlR family transcriptional regulator
MRAGTQALSLLSSPINICLLQGLAGGPMSLMNLRRETGSPPATTLRVHLRLLSETGVFTKHQQNGFLGSFDYELTQTGRALLDVAEILEAWLKASPEGSLALGSVGAKGAIKALAEGWSSNMLRALAAGPLSLTELDGLITTVSYPSLERRLAAMRLAGQIEAKRDGGRSTPYTVTDWLRLAVAPLAVAARWERLCLQKDAAQIRHLDAEAAFLLAAPLLSLASDISGACRLSVELSTGERSRLAGAMVTIDHGNVVACTSKLGGNPDAWAIGSPGAWLGAFVEHDLDGLELGGQYSFARLVLSGLHRAFFAKSNA